MKFARRTAAFTLIELLVVISIIGILITIAAPSIGTALDKARMTETLANAKSLRDATMMMTLDSQQAGSGLEWTTQITEGSGGEPTPVGLSTFLTTLVTDGYVTKQDMRKLLSAPGRRPVGDSYSADTIAFKIFAVSDNSPSDQPFVVTANVNPPTGGMNAKATPYGNKGFVVFNKGGGGGVFKRAQDATSTNIFPTSTGAEDGGSSYSYDTLK